MKNLKLTFVLLALALFGACGGDHTAKNGKDTTQNSYHVSLDSSKMDTSKVTSADNSATGGAALVKKDSSKMGKDSSKK